MARKRKQINIYLIFLTLALGVVAVWLTRRPNLDLSQRADVAAAPTVTADTLAAPADTTQAPESQAADQAADLPADTVPRHGIDARRNEVAIVNATSFRDIETRSMAADNPFRAEAMKVLSGRLEVNDSLSRHKILSYCEHLRTAYTTRDIDFIRQVFSDNALIIVGHVFKTGKAADMACSDRVKYSIRSKREYIERLARIFDTKKRIDVKFADFRIMRHPTVEGIYGVTLRQKYACDTYSDDGYLFLLWDFRDMSMPQIHVRTWQPATSLGEDGEMIDISDFNLE